MKPPVSGFEGLEDFCKDNLAYIIDEGFKINVDMPSHKDEMTLMDPRVKITIHKFNFPNFTKFNWNYVKDDVIPFLELLNKKYHFSDDIKFVIEYWSEGSGLWNANFNYSYDSVITDNIPINIDSKQYTDNNSLIKIEITKIY